MNDRCNSQPRACFLWPVSARPRLRLLRIDTPVVADVHYMDSLQVKTSFGLDASTDSRSQQHDQHDLTMLNSLTSRYCATFWIEFVQCLREHVMYETQGHIEATEGGATFR
jgi:hypothetical protein